MKIKCPKCDTLYDVSNEIAESGAQVQCAKCSDVFTAKALEEAEPPVDTEQENAPQAEEETGQPEEDSGLLTQEEKDFFASFSSPMSEEDLADPEKPEGTDSQAPEEPAKDELDADDIGWAEKEPESAEVESESLGETPDEPVGELIDEPESEPDQDREDIDPFEALETPEEVPDDPEDPAPEIGAEAESEAAAEPDRSEPVDVEAEAAPVDAPSLESADEPENLQPKLGSRHLLVGWGALAASLLLILSGATIFRTSVVKTLPGMAGIYEAVGLPINIRGLEFSSLSHQWMNANGRMRLVVRGEIVNITKKPTPVPEVVFAMVDKSGLEFFQWTEKLNKKPLQPLARTRFRAQIPAPADRVRQLKIRFAKRR